MITDIARVLVYRPYIWVITMYPRKIHKVSESDNGSTGSERVTLFIDLVIVRLFRGLFCWFLRRVFCRFISRLF